MTRIRMTKTLTALAVAAALAVPVAAIAQQPAAAPRKATAMTAPRVQLVTSQGTIVLELHPDKAPKTVESFLAYVRSGHYDGTVFHRVIPGFMIQGGGFTAEMKQKATRGPIGNEADTGGSNRRGTVAMARTGDPHSATAQFFINVADNAPLDHTAKTMQGWGYTVFAHVAEGMDVADAIVAVRTTSKGPHQNVPAVPVVIEKATVVGESAP
jgi:peptidyl-prolyl cis-trans isomerase B (cyclophilin B)